MTCTFVGCALPHHARGFCQRHLHRLARYGSPAGGGSPRSRSMLDRIAVLVMPLADGCWQWMGTTNWRGYGQATREDGRRTTAHRAVYEALIGPVPDGFELDHLCRRKLCVNPTHLEVVTHAENMRRMGAAQPRTTCTGVGCDLIAKAKGLCPRHYNLAYYAANAERMRQRSRDYRAATA